MIKLQKIVYTLKSNDHENKNLHCWKCQGRKNINNLTYFLKHIQVRHHAHHRSRLPIKKIKNKTRIMSHRVMGIRRARISSKQ
jgi:hypothetical protein